MRSAAALVLGVVLVLGGCGGSGARLEGECSARLRLAGATYGPDSRAQTSAPTGRRIRDADELDCDGSVVTPRAFEVHELAGVDPAVAVVVTTRKHRAVYVNQALPLSRWPASITAQSPAPG